MLHGEYKTPVRSLVRREKLGCPCLELVEKGLVDFAHKLDLSVFFGQSLRDTVRSGKGFIHVTMNRRQQRPIGVFVAPEPKRTAILLGVSLKFLNLSDRILSASLGAAFAGFNSPYLFHPRR